MAAVDAALILLALALVYLWRFGGDLEVPVVGTDQAYGYVAAAIGVLWWLALEGRGSRDRIVVGHSLEEYRRVLVASVHTFGAVAIVSYFLQAQLSRAFFLALMPLGVVLLLAGRWVCRQVLHAQRRRGLAVTPTLVVGAVREAHEAVRDLNRNKHAGFRPVAVALPPGEVRPDSDVVPHLDGLPAVDLRQIEKHVAAHSISAVVVARGLSREHVRKLAWQLENLPVELMFVPSLADVSGPRLAVNQLQDLSLVSVDLPRFSGWNHLLKRAFDVGFSAAALLLVSPLLLVIALLIKREDDGPIIFRQERVGLGGEPFVIHKFRTMHVDAEARLATLLASSDANGPLFKMAEDPRLTKIGRLLRKYSLDELPQFWTVLRGAMSVVGPRPHLAHELAGYPDDGLRRLLIKPGITGLWQVSGRSDLSFEEGVRLDLRYVENWSFAGDLTIILRTVRAIALSDGAY